MRDPGIPPVLSDGVVRLRALAVSDVDRLVEQCTDPDSRRWTTVPRHYTPELARRWVREVADDWAAGRERVWAIDGTSDPAARFLGSIALRPEQAGRAEVGYGLHADARGRGVMTAALRLVCRYWFGEFDSPFAGTRMTWLAHAGNLDSWAVAHRAGFRFVATLPGHLPDGDGRPVDAWCGTLVAGEPLQARHQWIEPPVRQTERVRLRPLRDDDHRSVEEPSHPTHFVPAGSVPTGDTWEAWLGRRRLRMALGDSANWAIADTATDRMVGEVLVFTGGGGLVGADTAELGYFVYPSARGRGFATQATRLAADHALAAGGFGVRRLLAETATDNAASNAVLRASGFRRWGHEELALAPDGSVGPADHWERYA